MRNSGFDIFLLLYIIVILIIAYVLFKFLSLIEKVFKNLTKIRYNRDRIVEKAAFSLISRNMKNDEIYTVDGSVRTVVKKKIDIEISKLNNFLDDKEADFLEILYSDKLLNKKNRMLKEVESQVVFELVDYYINNRLSNVISNNDGKDTNGITPDDFFVLRNHTSEDFTGVYIIFNENKRMHYVGQSKNVLDRINQHFTGHGNGDVYADYKYGDNFRIEFIKLSDSGYDNLDRLESDMITKYDAYVNGYNRNSGNG